MHPRRGVLLAMGTALSMSMPFVPAPIASAEEEETVELLTYYGAANPPASYGGIGGTTRDKARYSFLRPADWKEEAVSKVEKGANGTDSRFSSALKKEKVYVISLSNEGGRNAFKTSGAERTLESVSSSDAAVQDAIVYGEVTTSKRTTDDGQEFYDYVIESGSDNYLVSITTRQGRLFAVFVNTPNGRRFKEDRALLEKVRNSFVTYEVDIL